MPFFRGIEISVVPSSGLKKLPEYPHPDGSSVRLATVETDLNDQRNGGQISPRPFAPFSHSNTSLTLQKKTNPRISVYVPSIPGDQFRLRYLVSSSLAPSRFLFFKMYINGHHTVSWGIDANSSSAGSVSRSLYEPDEKFRDENGNPVMGIETRYFRFKHGLGRSSLAEDGGLIEIQVFRCRGRRRIAVVLDPYPHRREERYGIASPSGGLVNDPQDATFYEYHLEDPRDSPYATFCFHYRSTESLEELGLIPQSEARHRRVSEDLSDTSAPDTQEEYVHATPSPSTSRHSRGVEPLDTEVFDNIETIGMAIPEPPEASTLGGYCLTGPPQLSPAHLASLAAGDNGQAQRGESMADILQRPLPELPQTISRLASKESVRSNCPSLTPSLKQYVDSGEFENEGVRFNTAHPILLTSASTQAVQLSDTNAHDQGDNSFSNYTDSSDSTEASNSPALPSPEGYLPTTGSVLERHLNRFDSPIAQSSPKAKAKFPFSQSGGSLVEDVNAPETEPLKFTEAEWLRQSPSPLRRKGNLIERLWSPRPEKRPGHSSMVELSAREGDTTDSDGFSNKNSIRDSRAGNSIDEGPSGNWI
ncbi:hypothetical protein F5Y05DRAFT_423079 [Hypoxylon sp. FL0543]|nr:hypothetical protein F5Y05DRAFT_423079 [Hypoxylon sp. FL0543]